MAVAQLTDLGNLRARPRFSVFAACYRPKLAAQVLDASTYVVLALGQSLQSGTIVDASTIAAPSSTHVSSVIQKATIETSPKEAPK